MAVSLGTITSSDATFTLSIAGLFSAPQRVYQFAVDDAFDSEAVENGEIIKGVDNYMAAGWVPTMPKLNVTLMANSPSNDIFDQWYATEQQVKNKLIAQGVISLPGLRKGFNLLNAYLFSYMHIAPAKKTLQARKFVLLMDDITPAPL